MYKFVTNWLPAEEDISKIINLLKLGDPIVYHRPSDNKKIVIRRYSFSNFLKGSKFNTVTDQRAAIESAKKESLEITKLLGIKKGSDSMAIKRKGKPISTNWKWAGGDFHGEEYIGEYDPIRVGNKYVNNYGYEITISQIGAGVLFIRDYTGWTTKHMTYGSPVEALKRILAGRDHKRGKDYQS